MGQQHKSDKHKTQQNTAIEFNIESTMQCEMKVQSQASTRESPRYPLSSGTFDGIEDPKCKNAKRHGPVAFQRANLISQSIGISCVEKSVIAVAPRSRRQVRKRVASTKNASSVEQFHVEREVTDLSRPTRTNTNATASTHGPALCMGTSTV